MDSHILLEITLISAQDLKPPLSLPSLLHSYATISAASGDSPSPILRTRTDLVGSSNPTWNDKFVFRLPSSALSSPSSALDIRILAAAPWCLPDPNLGSVRLLLSNHHLRRLPTLAALGIRRPSGRFRGVLNVGLMLLSRVPNLAAAALAVSNAVGYRDLMGEGPRVLKEVNREMAVTRSKLGEDEKENEQPPPRPPPPQLCGLRRMQIHSSPSDQNLRISWAGGADDDDDEDEDEKKR